MTLSNTWGLLMSLFQNSVLRNYLENIDTTPALQAYERYRSDFLPKIANIRTSKEEQYQYGFLDDLFVKILGYTLNPSPDYNLIAEQKNLSDSKKADGAVLRDGNVIAVIELKSTKTRSMDKIVNQAFGYKHNHPTCKYVITSNFEKLRLYVEHSDKYEEFDLFELDESRFVLLYSLLAKESLWDDTPLTLKQQSKLKEENISNELYKKYATLRTNLFENIIQNNPEIDKNILLEKTQTILDRMVFIFFAEDRGILKPNTIQAIITHYKNDIEDRDLWHFYKIYFNAINRGNSKLGIPEYNGGLFADDGVLDSIIIDDSVIELLPLALSAYDFNTDIDVNILGHIFENSLNDIEELKARIADESFDASKSKRKKDGVFYTPEYITKYIVDNTLGSLCQAHKEKLGLDNIEIEIPKNPKKPTKSQTAQREALEAYREYLLSLKILDPACGSGAFLNQALNYLLDEHSFIDEGIRTLMGGSVLGLYDVKKGILENNLYGVDINAEAVEIAKLSLWLRTVESGRKLNRLADKIKVGNSLIDDKSVVDNAFVWEEEFAEVFEQGGFDVVIGNPPYGVEIIVEGEEITESYLLFYKKAIKLLKNKGVLGFITPDSWLTNNNASSIRKMFIDEGTISSLYDTYKAFSDAPDVWCNIPIFHKNIFVNEIKISRAFPYDLALFQFKMKWENIVSYGSNQWFPYINNDLMTIFDKMENNDKVEDYFDVKRGFSPTPNAKNITLNKTNRQIIGGEDFGRYLYKIKEKYLIDDYTKSLNSIKNIQTQDILGIQRIRTNSLNFNSRWLVTQFFDKRYVPIDSIGYFIQIKNLDLKYLLAIINSTLMNVYYKLHFTDKNVKPIYLKKLPLINISNKDQIIFIEIVDQILNLNKTLQSKKQKFLKRVTDNFELEKLSKKLEAFYKYDFKTFVGELKKKKIKLSLVEQDEWEEYFEAYHKELLELQSQIDSTDREIDKMVYELYGLSDEEIAVVEL